MGGAGGADRVDRVLALWKRARPDLDVSAKAVVGRVFRLQSVFFEAENALFESFGMTFGGYTVLSTLRLVSYPAPMAPRQMSKYVLFSSGGMTNILNRLQHDGLIERLPDPGDGRGVLVKLTPRGKEVIDRVLAAQARIERRLVASLSDNESEMLATLLHKLLIALDPLPEAPELADHEID
jgi:DNA-binding MarR family transcriptional regulator